MVAEMPSLKDIDQLGDSLSQLDTEQQIVMDSLVRPDDKAGLTVVWRQKEGVAWQDESEMMILMTDIDVTNSRLLGHLQH